MGEQRPEGTYYYEEHNTGLEFSDRVERLRDTVGVYTTSSFGNQPKRGNCSSGHYTLVCCNMQVLVIVGHG